MESTEKLYIISFGDSAKFRIKCADSKEELEKSKKLVDFENSLNSFLKEKFPAGNYTFYTTPAITEVYPEDAAKYDSYPELDAKGVEKIKAVLLKEVEDMQSTRTLNSDAPYSDVNQSAV
jgi:hypothetical protein